MGNIGLTALTVAVSKFLDRRRETHIFSSNNMNWVQRKIYLYNVTFGLYMLDWWERYLFNTLVLVLMWFIFYNGSRNLTEFYRRYLGEARL